MMDLTAPQGQTASPSLSSDPDGNEAFPRGQGTQDRIHALGSVGGGGESIFLLLLGRPILSATILLRCHPQITHAPLPPRALP